MRCLGHTGVKVVRGKRAHDDGAFGHESANAAGMIEVMVRWNHVANRFAGKPFFDGLDDRRGARLVERAFDGDQMIAHLDDDRRVGTTADLVHAIGELSPFDRGRTAEILVAHVARHAAQYPLRSDRGNVGLLIANLGRNIIRRQRKLRCVVSI